MCIEIQDCPTGNDDECSTNAIKKKCNSSKKCVQCYQSDHCTDTTKNTCFKEECQQGCTNHDDCQTDGKNKCFPYTGSSQGVCVECYASNQCTTRYKQKCTKETFQCVEDGGLLGPYTTIGLAQKAIFDTMGRTQDGIAAVQTSGASVAQIIGDTRYVDQGYGLVAVACFLSCDFLTAGEPF